MTDWIDPSWLSTWSWFKWFLVTFGVAGSVTLVLWATKLLPVLLKNRFGRGILYIGAAVLSVLLAFASGLRKGVHEEVDRQKKKTAKEIKEALSIKKKVNELSEKELDKELSKWDVKPK